MLKISTNCATCCKDFLIRKAKYKPNNNYCCRNCFHKRYNKKGLSKNCNICNKEFYVPQSKEKAKFCSQRCNAANKKKSPKNCESCKNIFIPRRKTSRFCSPECRVIGSKSSKLVSCKMCGRLVEKTISKLKQKNLFCNFDCSNNYSKRNQIEVKCQVCLKNIFVSKSRYKTFIACSKECLGKSMENNLEKKGYAVLKELNIDYIPQYMINNKFCVDAFVPKFNLIIQFDGDYWHGNSNKYKVLNKIQKTNIRRDKSHDAYMKKIKINVYRVWESEMDNFKNDMSKYIHD